MNAEKEESQERRGAEWGEKIAPATEPESRERVNAMGEGLPEAGSAKGPKTETAGESDDGKEEPPTGKRPGRKGPFAVLRRRWMILTAVGLLVAAGIVGYEFVGGRHGNRLGLEALLERHGKEGTAFVKTALKPFFVPLPEGSGDLAVKLIISVRWSPESLIRYKKRLVRIRYDIFQFLLKSIRSEKYLKEKKLQLQSGLRTVLQHCLAVKGITVSLDKVTPIGADG